MKYKGYTITSDNSFYRDGQHASRIESEDGQQTVWHDNFATALRYLKLITSKK